MSNLNKDEILEQELQVEQTNPVEEYVKELKEAKEQQNLQNNNERPEFLLPQFKNIEEQAKSYKELQALQTRQAQELAQYKKAETLNEQKKSASQQINALKSQAKIQEQKIKDIYMKEMENIQLALRAGKISTQEAQIYSEQLKQFAKEKLNNLANQFNQEYSKCGQALDLTSPKEYFRNDLLIKNYLEPICEFLEKNYKRLPKSELEGVKNLIEGLEKSLREEILNETKLTQENENYRKNLNSATNLNSQNNAEKIYTLAEIKKMKPEEFRKNQKAILEQFAARKIK